MTHSLNANFIDNAFVTTEFEPSIASVPREVFSRLSRSSPSFHLFLSSIKLKFSEEPDFDCMDRILLFSTEFWSIKITVDYPSSEKSTSHTSDNATTNKANSRK